MTDPNNFTVSIQDLIGALEGSVRDGVEQQESAFFFFQPEASGYELPRPAVAIMRVTGSVASVFTVFHPSQYGLSANRLVWHETTDHALPEKGARFEVEYTYRDLPSGLTDFNPGSVVGTLLRAVARELTLLYNQMDEAYRRAFIDGASGAALDNVVALLGVVRNPAQKAVGRVTFFRKKAATESIVIPAGTRVTDQSGRVFVTIEAGTIPAGKEGLTEVLTGDRKVKNLVAEIISVWPKDLLNQTSANSLKAAVADDGRTIVAAKNLTLPEGDLKVQYVPRSVTVAVEAVNSGTEGNVNAGAINIMPTPPKGIEGVTNDAPTMRGLPAEDDTQLRERARHALERGGNATLNAIKYAVLDVDGVRGVEVLDRHVDDTIPLGEVRVRYYGGDRNKVQEAVENTRAAGVMAYLDEIVVVLISGTFYVIPDTQIPPNAAVKFSGMVKDAVESLDIGAPLAIRRLNALAFNIPGIADVAEAQLKAKTGDGDAVSITDPLLVARSEMVRPDRANINVVFLKRLVWNKSRPGAGAIKYVIEIQINDERGSAVRFNDFAIDLRVTLSAGFKATPDQTPERIGNFTHTVQFTNSAVGELNITQADLSKFRSDTHNSLVEFVITAAAYPALEKIQKTFDVTT